jgi:hypothetical protein
MRSSFNSLLLLLAFVVAGPVSARADLITLSISEQATGTLGAQAFTNQLVTFSGSFTTQVLASCQADLTCVDGPGVFSIDNEADLPPADLGLTVTITVGGLGTFVGEGVDNFDFLYTGNLEDIVVLGAGDSGGRFGLPADPNLIGPNCSDYTYQQYCPPRAFTSGGELILTSAGDTYSTDVTITDTSAVPEPPALTLLALGLISVTAIFQRRLKS